MILPPFVLGINPVFKYDYKTSIIDSLNLVDTMNLFRKKYISVGE